MSAATGVALLASSVAANPFASLGWHPAEGLGLSPSLQEVWSFGARLALMCAIVSASMLAASVADDVGDLVPNDATSGHARHLTTTIAFLVIAVVGDAAGSLRAGMRDGFASSGGLSSALVPSLLAGALSWRALQAPALWRLLGGVGVLGCSISALLANAASELPVPLRILAIGSVIASALGAAANALISKGRLEQGLDMLAVVSLTIAACYAILGGASAASLSSLAMTVPIAIAVMATVAVHARLESASRIRWLLLLAGVGAGAVAVIALGGPNAVAPWGVIAGVSAGAALGDIWEKARQPSGLRPSAALLLTFALIAGSLASSGELLAIRQRITLPSGGRMEVQGWFGETVEVSHLGISRFDRPNAHVVAVGLDVSRRRTSHFLAAERRDYVDSRESPLATGVRRPAVLNTAFQQFRFRLDDVRENDAALLSLMVVPLTIFWMASAIFALMAAIVGWLGSATNKGRPVNEDTIATLTR